MTRSEWWGDQHIRKEVNLGGNKAGRVQQQVPESSGLSGIFRLAPWGHLDHFFFLFQELSLDIDYSLEVFYFLEVSWFPVRKDVEYQVSLG